MLPITTISTKQANSMKKSEVSLTIMNGYENSITPVLFLAFIFFLSVTAISVPTSADKLRWGKKQKTKKKEKNVEISD